MCECYISCRCAKMSSTYMTAFDSQLSCFGLATHKLVFLMIKYQTNSFNWCTNYELWLLFHQIRCQHGEIGFDLFFPPHAYQKGNHVKKIPITMRIFGWDFFTFDILILSISRHDIHIKINDVVCRLRANERRP